MYGRCLQNCPGRSILSVFEQNPKGGDQWPGPLRRLLRSASASRSTATCRPSSDPGASASRLNGAPHRHRARLGGGRWVSSMELSLPDMPIGMGGRRACAAPHPGEPCRQRGRRKLAADQRRPRPSRSRFAAPRRCIPRGGTRGSPIKAVLLTGAEIDQAAGLLSLRERETFTICGTAATLAALADNTMFSALAPDLVTRRAAVPGEPLALPGGLQAQLFTVPGKVPLYLEGENPETASETAANVGVEISAGSARLAFIPGAAAVTPAMMERIGRARRRAVRRHAVSRRRDDRQRDRHQDRPPHGAHAHRRRRTARLRRSTGLPRGASISTSTTPIRS